MALYTGSGVLAGLGYFSFLRRHLKRKTLAFLCDCCKKNNYRKRFNYKSFYSLYTQANTVYRQLYRSNFLFALRGLKFPGNNIITDLFKDLSFKKGQDNIA